jgi:hypothetical protein
MRRSSTLHSWIVLTIFGILAIILFLLSALLTLPSELHTLLQSVAEALIVSIVVALAVEPRLLRHFGEELASQTFWTSFYSRAPEKYRGAIRELASATQFTTAFHWKVTLDWADDNQTTIRLSSEITIFRENRSQKPCAFNPWSFIHESPLPSYQATIDEYLIICEGATFRGNPIRDGFSRLEHAQDGRLILQPAKESASSYFQVPPGLKYTIITKATTYIPELGYTPLVITTPTLSLTAELCGDALPDLWISILHPELCSSDTVISGTGTELAGRGSIPIGEICVTGQAILLSWARQQARRSYPAVERGASSVEARPLPN